ncbi:hypothetical protein R5R35_012565 [Gryllus longicercus]|uniref:eIF-4F 25 kDa subunit n=1 Tax=Gryllus longicercus TaxID=2509291 RepID=A0AAN9VJZ2_9ORTH|nr:Eukaryotic translation initiation factor 4E1 [Gryllus bimaculatus]
MPPKVIRGQGALEEDKKRLLPSYAQKHPLQHSWTWWFYETDKTKSWDENLKAITSFQTVEDFWSVYTSVKPASRLSHGCDYCVFKEGITPMWEDKANRRGGRWLMILPRRNRLLQLDYLWLETLMLMVGESFFHYGGDICGAVVNIRPRCDKIAIWTKDAHNKQNILAIGWKLKEGLGLGPHIPFSYQVHANTILKARKYDQKDE